MNSVPGFFTFYPVRYSFTRFGKVTRKFQESYKKVSRKLQNGYRLIKVIDILYICVILDTTTAVVKYLKIERTKK